MEPIKGGDSYKYPKYIHDSKKYRSVIIAATGCGIVSMLPIIGIGAKLMAMTAAGLGLFLLMHDVLDPWIEDRCQRYYESLLAKLDIVSTHTGNLRFQLMVNAGRHPDVNTPNNLLDAIAVFDWWAESTPSWIRWRLMPFAAKALAVCICVSNERKQ